MNAFSSAVHEDARLRPSGSRSLPSHYALTCALRAPRQASEGRRASPPPALAGGCRDRRGRESGSGCAQCSVNGAGGGRPTSRSEERAGPTVRRLRGRAADRRPGHLARLRPTRGRQAQEAGADRRGRRPGPLPGAPEEQGLRL